MARGSIRKRSQGSYNLRWPGPVGRDGRRKRQEKTVQVRNKREAEAELRRLMLEQENPPPANLHSEPTFKPSDISLTEGCRRYFEEREGKDLRSSSAVSYRSFAQRYLLRVCGDVTLADVDRNAVQSVINAMVAAGLAPYTVKIRVGYLHSLFTWFIKVGYLEKSPVRGLTLPEVIRRPVGRTLSSQEALALLAFFEGTKYWTAVFLALHTGMRIGEVLGLAWDCVDLEGAKLSVEHSLSIR